MASVVAGVTRRPPLIAWRDPSKVVVTKSRIHGWWLVTLFARRTCEFETYGQAIAYVRLVISRGPVL